MHQKKSNLPKVTSRPKKTLKNLHLFLVGIQRFMKQHNLFFSKACVFAPICHCISIVRKDLKPYIIKNTMIDKAVKEFLESLERNAKALAIVEPKWLKAEKEANRLQAQRIEWNQSVKAEEERQRIWNQWEDILS